MVAIVKDPRFMGSPNLSHPGWAHRMLYTSPVAVEEWLRLSSTDSYPGADAEADPVLTTYVNCLGPLGPGAIRHMVSLGPGDGRVDARLLRHLTRVSSPLNYFPIDISEHLLQLSAAQAARLVGVPVAVCADFEEDTGFIADVLKPKREGPVLWSFLGNTLGALDKGEANFVEKLRPLLLAGDFFLLSVTNHPFEITADPPLWDALRQLVGCLRRIQTGGATVAATACDPRGISLRTRTEAPPAASAVEFVLEDGDTTVLAVRCYLLEALIDWLLARLPLLFIAQDRFRPADAAFGVSTALFRVT